MAKKYDSATDTILHIAEVRKTMDVVVKELRKRALNHDESKLSSPEKETYDTFIPLLKEVKYGTPEYFEVKNKMYGASLGHHFEANRHHPEHYPNGIDGMTLVDLMEMFVDWYSASLRSDTSFEDGLSTNIEKYDISPQLEQIIRNTFSEYFKK